MEIQIKQQYSANNVSLQIKVKGFKSKSMWNGTLYYNDEEVQYVLNQTGSGTYNTSGNWTESQAFDTIPSNLRPKHNVYSIVSSSYLRLRVNASSGKIEYQTTQSVSNPYIQCVMNWLLP